MCVYIFPPFSLKEKKPISCNTKVILGLTIKIFLRSFLKMEGPLGSDHSYTRQEKIVLSGPSIGPMWASEGSILAIQLKLFCCCPS